MCCWCIGEYGAFLLDGSSLNQIVESEEGNPPTPQVVITEDEVATMYQQILWDNQISVVTKQVCLKFHSCNFLNEKHFTGNVVI